MTHGTPYGLVEIKVCACSGHCKSARLKCMRFGTRPTELARAIFGGNKSRNGKFMKNFHQFFYYNLCIIWAVKFLSFLQSCLGCDTNRHHRTSVNESQLCFRLTFCVSGLKHCAWTHHEDFSQWLTKHMFSDCSSQQVAIDYVRHSRGNQHLDIQIINKATLAYNFEYESCWSVVLTFHFRQPCRHEIICLKLN